MIKFGIVGVAVGTVAAMLFRTLQYGIYMSKNLVILLVFSVFILIFDRKLFVSSYKKVLWGFKK